MISQMGMDLPGFLLGIVFYLITCFAAWPGWFIGGLSAVVAGSIAVRFFLGRTRNAKLILVCIIVLPAIGLWLFGVEVRGMHGLIMPQGFAAIEAAVLNSLAAAVGWTWVRSSPAKKL